MGDLPIKRNQHISRGSGTAHADHQLVPLVGEFDRERFGEPFNSLLVVGAVDDHQRPPMYHLDAAGLAGGCNRSTQRVLVEAMAKEHFGDRDRRRQIDDLVATVQREIQFLVGGMNPGNVGNPAADGKGLVLDGEVISVTKPASIGLGDPSRHRPLSAGGQGPGDHGAVLVEDRGLLAGNLTYGLAKILGVVEGDPGDGSNVGVHDVGRIPPSAKSDFDHRDVDRSGGERRQRQRGRELEICDAISAAALVFLDEPRNLGNGFDELVRSHRSSVYDKALLNTVEVG